MQGKLIVIEGQDGVGKGTQVSLLCDDLRARGMTVRNLHFPIYESRWGALIRQNLDGDSPFDLDPGYASILFAADRGEAVPMIREALDRGEWVICDRYVSSSIAAQGIAFAERERRDAFIMWLEELEYGHFKAPKPDLTILMSLPAEVSFARVSERRSEGGSEDVSIGKRDPHEDDIDLMKEVTKEYHHLAHKNGWEVLACSEKNPHEIHEGVMKIIVSIL